MNMHDLSERLFKTLSHPNFLRMKGLANEVPIFIQTYEPAHEDGLRRMVESLAIRLQSAGITLKSLDLFELVLEELEEHKILAGLLTDETTWQRSDVLETLQNYSDPKTHMIPRLIRAIEGDGGQLTLITGPGRIFPFLRTHTILESLQPAMLRHHGPFQNPAHAGQCGRARGDPKATAGENGGGAGSPHRYLRP
jgi:hypothetical protein